MYINLQKAKNYCDNISVLNTIIVNYINEPSDKDSISFHTLNELKFLKKDYFDLGVIESYDISLYRVVMKEIVRDFIWFRNNVEDISEDDLIGMSEDEYLEHVRKNESDMVVGELNEATLYYKTFKASKLLTKKSKKYIFDISKISDSEVLGHIVSESLDMIMTEGEGFNTIIEDSLKKLNIIG